MQLEALKRVYHDKGDTIFSEGDVADNAYFVEEGVVNIVLKDKRGKRKVIAHVTSGEFFGEMALIDDQRRSASAVVKKETMCVMISKDEFRRHIKGVDPLTQALVNLLTKRLRTAMSA